MAAVTLLKSICSEMATATEALLRLRPKLEEHDVLAAERAQATPAHGHADEPVAPPMGRPAVAQGGAAANGFKTGRWTDDEHATFLDLLKVHGKSWTAIARAMPHRSEPRSRRASVSLVIRASPKRSSPPAQANPIPAAAEVEKETETEEAAAPPPPPFARRPRRGPPPKKQSKLAHVLPAEPPASVASSKNPHRPPPPRRRRRRGQLARGGRHRRRRRPARPGPTYLPWAVPSTANRPSRVPPRRRPSRDDGRVTSPPPPPPACARAKGPPALPPTRLPV